MVRQKKSLDSADCLRVELTVEQTESVQKAYQYLNDVGLKWGNKSVHFLSDDQD